MSSTPSIAPAPRFRISRHRILAWWGSGLACLLSLIGLLLCWFNPAIGAPLRPGLDFTGGTQIQLERACGVSCSALSSAQIQQPVARLQLPAEPGTPAPNLASAAVQVLDQGRSLVLRLPAVNPEQAAAVVAAPVEPAGRRLVGCNGHRQQLGSAQPGAPG